MLRPAGGAFRINADGKSDGRNNMGGRGRVLDGRGWPWGAQATAWSADRGSATGRLDAARALFGEAYSDCGPDLLTVTHDATMLIATPWGSIVQAYLLMHAP
jgi:hypothetical protein